MAKRLLLLAGALTIALVAFGGVYWLTSDTAGPRTSAPPPADIAPAGDTQISGITAPGGLKIYETDNPVIIGPRDLKDNHIPYKFGFERRGKSDSGELVIVRPWARFYDRSGQVIQITADEAIVPITESGGETEIPQNGNLKGNVIIQMFASIDSDSEPPLPYEAKPGDLPPAQLTVELDEVVFDREHSSLSSDGPLNIESAEMILHGRGLERLIYDQVNRRVQDLEIRHVEELLIAAELLEKQDNDSSAAKADNTASPTPSALTTDS
ncbi:MAG: hypothetical protein JW709_06510, partial [Sedimentisphaerales bacterium]|nr:hypothetical protein [Sedimentisphaerales bacterium]